MSFNNNSIYSVNFSALTTMLTPPLLRNSNMDAWTTAQSAELQIDNILFTQYLTGSTYPIFSASTTYFPGNRVIASPNGFNNEIFENLTGSTFTALTDTNTWLPVNPSFIGAEERSLYNSQKILYEWALNRQFQILPQNANPNTIPWTGANHVNQIYIGTNSVTPKTFIVSSGETYSSNMTKTGTLVNLLGGQWMGTGFTTVNNYEFSVYVPNITSYTGISNSVVSAYTQTYAIAGMTFNVVSY